MGRCWENHAKSFRFFQRPAGENNKGGTSASNSIKNKPTEMWAYFFKLSFIT